MNKVITINLNGTAYQLEEDGYEALRTYMESAGRRLDGNPDKAEIIADIEQSIGDKFRALLGAVKNVVATKEVQDVIAEMGPVQDGSEANETPAAAPSAGRGPAGGGSKEGPAAGAAASAGAKLPKRLYRIREGAKIGGVCNGLAAYFGIEVTIVRLLFVFLFLTFGSGILVYIIMMLVIPEANTAAEVSEAFGEPFTAEEFIRRGREGYYAGMRTFGDKRAYREWKRRFKQEMRQHKNDFKREVHQNLRKWRWDWGHQWGPSPANHEHWFAASFLSLLITIVSLIGLCAVASLVLTGSVFTLGLPVGMPLWVGVVFLILIFHILKWPLKAARRATYYHYGVPYGPGRGIFSFAWCSVGWIVFILAVVWLANHSSPRSHEVLGQLRHEAHRAVDAVSDWWNKP
jgi:phage shock protein PspC (stress-responsive transcriptional regulator)